MVAAARISPSSSLSPVKVPHPPGDQGVWWRMVVGQGMGPDPMRVDPTLSHQIPSSQIITLEIEAF
ncbi:hypothetical protein BDA96_02G280500 [Sorghum bicolor]|uniref:Uncharacterized protein n=2 Tax=Sorghum bicolor TaxID=4558 RepID=A0A921RQZ9_SORBI|nr:hypothetical protein BDA96_02G280500 [Sorghum bicolor]OQU89787.1 hypothetical protein SORBI_3002G267050 [Sorghum bicolor]